MIRKSASALWIGDLKSGTGNISTESGVLDTSPYGFNTRFEGEKGTNPEELIAAAHAGCFSMALSAELGKAGITADRINATATVHLDKDGDGFSITRSALAVTVVATGADKPTVEAAARAAETGCPVSKVLNAEITLELSVEV